MAASDGKSSGMAPRSSDSRVARSSYSLPRRAILTSLVVAFPLANCGRIGLDAPVSVGGSAGDSTAAAGEGGATGAAGRAGSAGGAAGACVDGETRCVSGAAQQFCRDGVWSPAVNCVLACFGKACGMAPRRVFVSSQTFIGGTLGGLAAADAACQQLAGAAGLQGTYLAWLSDDTGSPASRFPRDVGPYLLVDNLIIANNWQELTSGTLRSPIEETEFGASPPTTPSGCPGAPVSVWSDTASDGTLADPLASCDDWSNSVGETVILGGGDGSLWSQTCRLQGLGACGASARLYCFEQ
jgi:hypothetical protein